MSFIISNRNYRIPSNKYWTNKSNMNSSSSSTIRTSFQHKESHPNRWRMSSQMRMTKSTKSAFRARSVCNWHTSRGNKWRINNGKMISSNFKVIIHQGPKSQIKRSQRNRISTPKVLGHKYRVNRKRPLICFPRRKTNSPRKEPPLTLQCQFT